MTLSYPYDCVCYITDVIGNTAYRASGVIIGPHTILTASHVVWSADDGGQSATDIEIYPGYYPGDTASGISGVSIHYNAVDDANDEISQSQSQNDFAVIDVSQNLSAYGSFNILTNYAGGSANIAGYPGGSHGTDYTQQDTSGTVTQDANYSLIDYSASFDVNPGSSGGPIWVNEGTTADPIPEVVGLVSTNSWGAQITSADLTEIENWVSQDGYSLSASSNYFIPSSNGGDLFWQNTLNGMASVWELNGSSASGYNLPSISGWQIEDYGDFTGNGVNADLVLRNTSTGMVDIWTDVNGLMSGQDIVQVGLDWNIMGTADFNGDGKSDILWRNEQNGDVSVWLMNGDQVQSTWNPGPESLSWKIVGAADYAGTGDAQILWRNAVTGEVDMWSFNPSTGQASGSYVATEGLQWEIVGSGDFFGNGKADILWRDNSDGQVVIWEMNGTQVVAAQAIANLGEQWQVASVVDANGDGKDDIVWHDTGTGQIVLWEMNGFNVQQADVLGTVAAGWQPLNHHYDYV